MAGEGSFQQRQQLREHLRSQPNCRFLGADTYRQLLVSRDRLLRDDQTAAGLRGLYNPATGIRFLIEEELLLEVA